MEQQNRLKHEILEELRARHLRWLRNTGALVGCALVVGCTTGLNPLVGGIVLGILLFSITVSGMILSRKTSDKKEAE